MDILRSIPRKIERQFKQKTAIIRKLPDFLIIGAQRCGTTSFYHYLCEHPGIVSRAQKEIHFYDLNFERGGRWYKQFFPTAVYASYLNQFRKFKILCGDATPMYLFHPLVPYRVSMMQPDVKLIVLLRNPVERAYSHYWHEVRTGNEWVSFEEAIEREGARLKGERHKIVLSNGRYSSARYYQHSYLSRGCYVDQMRAWFRLFSEKQILIIKSEEFFSNTSAVLESVCEFLELSRGNWSVHEIHQKGDYSPMAASCRKRLTQYFKPYNERLYDLIGREFNWEGE